MMTLKVVKQLWPPSEGTKGTLCDTIKEAVCGKTKSGT